MFSGPSPRKDGLAAYLVAAGIGATDMDLVNGHLQDQDIADDSVWERTRQRLRQGEFDFVFAGPPCRTFSEARAQRPGPPVLRSPEHPYGYPKSQAWQRGLHAHHFEQIRVDNLLAERTAEACTIMLDSGGGFAVEHPRPWRQGTSSVTMFDFESFNMLVKR
jgi:hypothetical protein